MHRLYKALLLLLVLAGFGISCSDQKKNGQYKGKLFNSERFFTKEAKDLKHDGFSLKKTDHLQNDTAWVKQPNWEKELNSFIAENIDKPKNQGKYIIEEGAGFNTYSALDSTLPVKRIEVYFKDQKESKIIIKAGANNFFYRFEKTLVYNKDSSFEIKGYEKLLFMELATFHFKGLIKK